MTAADEGPQVGLAREVEEVLVTPGERYRAHLDDCPRCLHGNLITDGEVICRQGAALHGAWLIWLTKARS